VRDKGTNRQQFLNGQVDKYTWQDKGSSYLLSELSAAFLLSQLEEGKEITARRLSLWQQYYNGLADLQKQGHLQRMMVPSDCQANAHIFYIYLNSVDMRAALWAYLKEAGIQSTTHYVALHSAPAGVKYGRVAGSMNYTDDLSNRLLRLPMYADLKSEEAAYVIEKIHSFFKERT